ncbi:UNVERIFIED_CONTAM: hypothetical protein OHV15_12140 [Microbacterium sp. SLM126]
MIFPVTRFLDEFSITVGLTGMAVALLAALCASVGYLFWRAEGLGIPVAGWFAGCLLATVAGGAGEWWPALVAVAALPAALVIAMPFMRAVAPREHRAPVADRHETSILPRQQGPAEGGATG